MAIDPSTGAGAGKVDFDLDEDLFDFDEVGDTTTTGADYDLDEIFSAFEEAEADREAQRVAEDSPRSAPVAADPAPAREAVLDPAPEPASAAPTPPPVLPSTPASTPARSAKKAAPAAGQGLNKSLLLILGGVMTVNAMMALVVVKSTGDMQQSLVEVGREVVLSNRGPAQAGSMPERDPFVTPQLSPEPETHPTFATAREEIERGEYASARRRLYALLAIVDRLDTDARADVEARANYLLAQARHLEALARLERDR